MHPYHHSLSSVKKFGGEVDDYMAIHSWFDESKQYFADFRHRALRHHAQGIFEAEKMFGDTIVNSDGRTVPVRYIGEQHVREDLGRIPSLQDYLMCIDAKPWMHGRPKDTDAAIVAEAEGRKVVTQTMSLLG